MPRPRPNSQRTARSVSIPAAIPANDVARPSCQLPCGNHVGSCNGCQTGHGNTPGSNRTFDTRPARPNAGTSTCAAGNGQATNSEPRTPKMVPVSVIVSGISM